MLHSTSEISVTEKFAEILIGEVLRFLLPGTSVNRPPSVHTVAMNGIIDASREESP
jgi:hypothetical protein